MQSNEVFVCLHCVTYNRWISVDASDEWQLYTAVCQSTLCQTTNEVQSFDCSTYVRCLHASLNKRQNDRVDLTTQDEMPTMIKHIHEWIQINFVLSVYWPQRAVYLYNNTVLSICNCKNNDLGLYFCRWNIQLYGIKHNFRIRHWCTTSTVSQKSSPSPKTFFAIFSLRLSIFLWNLASLLPVYIHTYFTNFGRFILILN